MTPSEHLWAEAEARANAPEHMRELLSLLVDRATWEIADRINHSVGRSTHYQEGLSSGWKGSPHWVYAMSLHRYIQLKLTLHRVKNALVYNDSSSLLNRVDTLRLEIAAARESKNEAIWGDLPGRR